MKYSLVAALATLGSFVAATPNTQFLNVGRLIPPEEPMDASFMRKVAASNITGSAFFDQIIDHNDLSKGTFKQKFWWNTEFWAGPGSPIVFFTPGEIAAAGYTGYLTNATITGLYAQEIKGAVIMVEHRFWGESSPYATLTAETLQTLTLDQAMNDFVHFAKTAALPFDLSGATNADKAPWVFSGGSYSGALAAWIYSVHPGTFWAYHASSAPVEAIYDYWQYFTPVQEGMPKNCSKDVGLVVEYMDEVFTKGTPEEQLALKTKFGLQDLTLAADVTAALVNGPWLWQSNSFTTGYSGFFKFCDAIENVVAGAAVTPDANGVGLEAALEGYAKWSNEVLIPGYCENYGFEGEYNIECMDTYNATNLQYTNRAVDNIWNLQWNWMLCNEPFGYWQDGAPRGKPTIVSRLVTAEYWQGQCPLMFPETNGFTYGSVDPDVNAHKVNKFTQGWRLEKTERLIWTNGQFDPWKTSGMSAEERPGGALAATDKAPLNVIPGGFHCSDLRLTNARANAGVQAVVDRQVAQIVEWVAEFPKK
ncbi:hypothetical protein HYFRA_00012097 [Hymenoscyphus fraxineus]|uniref:Serine peptidase n=1 Tax=Hymenoscyphus fraxineus TaxID=746836 RepID=A0A9N9PUG7_9HELO|nr:hypothetical protein HYFRA_00012097 [Hymenoscyphus fraxineus]